MWNRISKRMCSHRLKNFTKRNVEIPFEILRKIGAHKYYVDSRDLFRWQSYLEKNPLSLKDSKNKELVQKMEMIIENSKKLVESHSYDSKEHFRQNAQILKEDLELLCEEVKVIIEDAEDLGRVFEKNENDSEREQNFQYLILCVNSILEKNGEFTETVEKLKLIQSKFSDKAFSTKFRIILENLIVYSEKYGNSTDLLYRDEFRKMIQKINLYLDRILNEKEESTMMEDIAAVRAIRDYVS